MWNQLLVLLWFLYDASFFSYYFQGFLWLCLSTVLLGSLWVFVCFSYLSLVWMCNLTFFHQIWEFWGHYIFKYFSISFSPLLLELPLSVHWYVWWYSTGLWGSVHLFFHSVAFFPLPFSPLMAPSSCSHQNFSRSRFQGSINDVAHDFNNSAMADRSMLFSI